MNKLFDKKLNPDNTSNAIFFLSLIFSCVFVAIAGWNFSKNIVMQCIFSAMLILADVFAQWSRSRGQAYREAKKKGWQIYYVFFYAYISLVSIPSAIGIFSSEVNAAGKHIDTVENERAQLNTDLVNINFQISNQNLFLIREAQSGYGTTSKSIMSNLNELNTKLTNVKKQLKELPEEKINIQKDYFGTLSRALWFIPFLTADLIKTVMFGMVFGLLQFALIVCGLKTNPDKVYKQNEQDGIKLFVNNLFRPSGSLNGLDAISKLTGMTVSECRKHQKRLIEMGMITTARGGPATDKTINEILEVIK